jgi:acetoin utilization deacetylase AcuC-like enzyme
VLFFSTHNQQAYPGTGDPARTGEGAGTGFNINVHLDCGAGDATFDEIFDDKLIPAAASFKPELVLISAGFDSKRNDQLGCFDITPCGFSRLTRKVMQLAEEHAQGRVVSLLEGGYADSGSSYTYNGLASSVEAHVATLLSGDLYPAGCTT